MPSLIRSTSPRPSAPPRLAAYLAGAVGTTALLTAPQTEAAVISFEFGFGPTYEVGDGSGQFDAGTGTLYGLAGYALRLGESTNTVYGSLYHTASNNPASGLATFFEDGTLIGNGGNGERGLGFFYHNKISGLDFTSDQMDKNIAFKTSTNNWGWANVSWSEANKVLTVHSASVEDQPNTPITIPVPEPSSALLALAGLGGMALRRRRKLAA